MDEEDNQLTKDGQHMNRILAQTLEQATTFLSSLSKRSVVAQQPDDVTIVMPPLPKTGVGTEGALKVFEESYAKRISGSSGSRYLGFVTGGSTPAALAGDWLVSVFDQNAMSSESFSPFIERETLQWLAQMFGLSAAHHGSFVTGATMANFVGLAIGRQWVAHDLGVDVAVEGLYALPRIKILSGAPHSSVYKAISMLGMGKNALQIIPCLPNREAVNLSELRKQLEDSQDTPCIVVANAGTVNTVDFDDLPAIAELKKEFNFWLHVDAAFGGFAACSPRYSHLAKGLDGADSITIDAHKWLNVPYDSAMQFTRHRQLQFEVFRNSAAYLGDLTSATAFPDFVHLTPENSRRLRALPAWFTVMAYGSQGYCSIVEQSCDMARSLGEKIEQSVEFDLLSPVRLNVVCFTLAAGQSHGIHRFLEALHEQGQVFMTPTLHEGVPAIRAAFSNWRTRAQDVDIAWKSLVETFHQRLWT